MSTITTELNIIRTAIYGRDMRTAIASAIEKVNTGIAADVRATVITGVVFTTNSAILTTDTVLVAFGKLQAQTTARLPLAGGTMTGAIAMGTNLISSSGTPTSADHLTRKGYVDAQDALRLALTGGTMTGAINMGANLISSTVTPTAADHLTRKGYVDAALVLKEALANKGAVNGYAGLDAAAKILMANLPDFVLGQLLFGGNVNASTAVATLSDNAKTRLGTALATITLTNNTTAITGYKANEGIFYLVRTAGTFAGIEFGVGDWLISIGSAWDKIDNTDAVTGVKGNIESTYRIGNINLTCANIGAVNLTGDTMTGLLKFNIGGRIDTPLDIRYGNVDGSALLITAGALTVIGSGEFPQNFYATGQLSATVEELVIGSDNSIYFYSNGQSIANRLGMIFDTNGSLKPVVSGKTVLGTASNRWGDAYINKMTMNGVLNNSLVTNSYLSGNQGTALVNSSAAAGSYVTVFKTNSMNGYFTLNNYQGMLIVGYTSSTTVTSAINSLDKQLVLLNESGNTLFPGTVSANKFEGVQTTLVSGTSIKTINGISLLGSGDVAVSAIGGDTAVWGKISGSLSTQTDLKDALNGKLSLTGGTMTGDLNVVGTISSNNIGSSDISTIGNGTITGAIASVNSKLDDNNFTNGNVKVAWMVGVKVDGSGFIALGTTLLYPYVLSVGLGQSTDPNICIGKVWRNQYNIWYVSIVKTDGTAYINTAGLINLGILYMVV